MELATGLSKTGTMPLWDDAHIKALLRLLRAPVKLIQAEPWHSWILAQGGLQAVYRSFRELEGLPKDHKQLLIFILDHPSATAESYARRLNVDRSTYFERLQELIYFLKDYLNTRDQQPDVALTKAPELDASNTTATTSNIPVPATTFIGRKKELSAVCGQIQQENVRVLTLTGPGGVGKTRLAIQSALEVRQYFKDGVYFIFLESIDTPSMIVSAIARALGVREAPGKPALDSLCSYLQDKEALLILDNFEHLLDGAHLVASLLSAAPNLKILATSRGILNIRAEREFKVPSLSIPALHDKYSVNDLMRYEAVQLFIDRVSAMVPDFMIDDQTGVDVIALCEQLDGLPLAIELAAARIRFFSPRVLTEKLKVSLDALGTGYKDLPHRQQTLRNAMQWSYNLLNDIEKKAFHCISVFEGGFTLEAAESICGPSLNSFDVTEVLVSLTSQGLIQSNKDQSGLPRFRMLRVIHEYAKELLLSDDSVHNIRTLHANYYALLVRQSREALLNENQAETLDLLDREQYNIRASLHWAIQNDADEALRTISVLAHFWLVRGYLSEGQVWIALVLEKSKIRADERARVLSYAGSIARLQGRYDEAVQYLEEALEIFRETGGRNAQAAVLNKLGNIRLYEKHYDDARALYNESFQIHMDEGDLRASGVTLNNLGQIAYYQGNLQEAISIYERCLEIYEQSGDLRSISIALGNIGDTLFKIGDYKRAISRYIESLDVSEKIEDIEGILIVLLGLAKIEFTLNKYESAARILGAVGALNKSVNIVFTDEDMIGERKIAGLVMEQLSTEVFDSSYANGACMSLTDMLGYARSIKE